jgi:hypothetical protein
MTDKPATTPIEQMLAATKLFWSKPCSVISRQASQTTTAQETYFTDSQVLGFDSAPAVRLAASATSVRTALNG